MAVGACSEVENTANRKEIFSRELRDTQSIFLEFDDNCASYQRMLSEKTVVVCRDIQLLGAEMTIIIFAVLDAFEFSSDHTLDKLM